MPKDFCALPPETPSVYSLDPSSFTWESTQFAVQILMTFLTLKICFTIAFFVLYIYIRFYWIKFIKRYPHREKEFRMSWKEFMKGTLKILRWGKFCYSWQNLFMRQIVDVWNFIRRIKLVPTNFVFAIKIEL